MGRWLMALLLVMLTSLAARAAEAYACYTPSSTTLTFWYDDQRASRTGTTYDLNVGGNSPGWYTDGTYASVTKVVFNLSFASFRPTSTYKWFNEMTQLQTISGITYLKTDEVTDMRDMFNGCRKLTSIDVSRFNTSNVIYMTSMFYGCRNLQSLDLRNFNTSNVTNMAGMFAGCDNMESIDVSYFNTAKVNNMALMFEGCDGLTTIYAGSEWSTAAVTTSDYMFHNSPCLVGGQGTTYDANHLDVSYAHIDGGPSNPGYFSEKGPEPYACFTEGNRTLTFYHDTQRRTREGTTYDLNTGTGTPGWRSLGSNGTITKVVFDPSFADARPTSTCDWFYYMTGLTSITGISYLNTSQVTNMKNMFFCCNHLTSLDVSHFNTANVNTMYGMFRSCSSVTSLDVSHFNTAKVTDMAYMFDGCSGLTSLDVSSFNTANVTTMKSMFNCYNLTSLDVSNFNTANVTDMSSMFYSCNKLTSLDVSHFNTAKVTTMSKMFYNCSGLANLQLGNFNTAKVTDMSGMFNKCTALTSLDLRGFNTSIVTAMGEMFYWCTNLVCISVGDGWTTDAVTSSSQMFNNCTSIVGEKGTTYDSNHKDAAYAHIDGGPSNPGYLTAAGTEAYACFTPSNKTLTFYYDGQRGSRTGTTYDMDTGDEFPAWYFIYLNDRVNKVVFDPSFAAYRPTSTYCWFSGMEHLTSITGISYLNTEKVTTMLSMFYGCEILTDLDVSGFNTANVTNMRVMFYNCKVLTSLDVSGFNTANVTDMSSMFSGCENLTSLDLSNWNTANVTDMDMMFHNCKVLTSLDLSSFNTSNVTKMTYMFDECENLTSLDLSSFNTSNVTDMDRMFYHCKALTSLDLSSFNTAKVTGMNGMFDGCVNLTSLDLSSFNTSNVTDMQRMFHGCANLTSLDLSGFNTSNVTDMDRMFASCSSLTTLDLSSFNTSNVTKMNLMFDECKNLASLDLSSFNTSNVTNMDRMFFLCKELTSLDVSSFNTANVTDMSQLFRECSQLETIYVGEGWSTDAVTKSVYMFVNSTKLVGGQGTTFDPNHVDKAYAHIDGGPSNPGYFTAEGAEPWHDPEAYACYTPSNTTLTFYYDSERSTREGTTYDLNVDMANPGWDDDNSYASVTHVVFDPSFAEARPVSTCSWFWGMTNLQSITGMDCLNTEDVTTMWGMFNSCSNLTTLDLSSFNTSQVTNMLGMFSDCSNLTTIYAGEGWNVATVSVSSNMFANCTHLVGGKGTTYDPGHTNKAYAHIDGGPSNPGYFTGTIDVGDVNGDGNVNITDVTVLNNLLSTSDPTVDDYPASDIDGNGVINITDVTMLINKALMAKKFTR